MKKITLLLLFLLTMSLGYSQSLPIDFTDPLDNNFVGQGGAVFTSDVNPDDNSDNVGKIVGGTDQYNSRIDLALDTYIDMTTPSKTFTFKFYTTEAVVMNGLFQLGNKEAGGAEVWPIEKTFFTNGTIGWQTITLDMATATNGYPNAGNPVEFGQYAQVSVFTNFADTGTSTYYVDDIAGAANGTATPQPASDPATGAANPIARLTEDYMSFYNGIASPSGDEYVNETVVNFDNFGGGTTIVGDVVLGDGNTVKKYTAHNYSGIGGGSYDVSAMEKLHIDVYFDGAPAEFQLKLESPGGVGNGQVKIVEIGPASGEWLSFDIDLSFFTAADLTNLLWIVPVTAGTADIMYFDNIYFWKAPFDTATDANLSDLTVDGSTVVGFAPGVTTYDIELPLGTTVVPTVVGTSAQASPATAVTSNAASLPGASSVLATAQDGTTTKTYTVNFTVALPVPTTAPTTAPARNVGDVISIFSNGAYADITLAELPTSWSESTFNPAFDAGGVDVWEMTGEFIGMQTTGVIDLTAMETLHIDYWTAESNGIDVKLVGAGPAQSSSQSLGSTVTGSWQSIEINMSLYQFDLSAVFQLLIDPAGPNTMYVANFYFSKGLPLSIEENELIQFSAYPNPTENVWNIKSLNEAINSIQVYDILGKVVLTMNPNTNEAQIDASGLNTGLYFAKVNSAVGSKTIKLIKK